MAGNTWNPNQQGADEQGRYPDGLIWQLQAGEQRVGENLEIAAAAPVAVYF